MAIGPPPTESALNLAAALINTSHLPLLLFDGHLRVVRASPSFCVAFDLRRDQADGHILADLGAGEWDMPELRLLLENALLADSEVAEYETDLLRVGHEPRRLVLNVQELVHNDRQDARILLTINDVSGARLVERANVALLLEKDDLLREREVLLQEMQHRVANSLQMLLDGGHRHDPIMGVLQIIASVLLLKARTVKSEETRSHLQDAHDRVMSVAAVQQHLQSSVGDVEIRPYLTKLCESLASSMIRESRPLALEVRADEATISSHEAVSLGLIVTELVINALKHAFPDGQAGLILVVYQAAAPLWTLSVIDNGVGRPSSSPAAKIGLGTSVVEALAKQLGAHVVMSDARPGARISIVRGSAPTLQ